MDLCVGCKACKTECPSQVDVATMKTEVLSQMGKTHGFSVRQKAAGHIRRQLALAAHLPSLYNALAGTRACPPRRRARRYRPPPLASARGPQDLLEAFPVPAPGTRTGRGRALQRHLERVPAPRGRRRGRPPPCRRGGEGVSARSRLLRPPHALRGARGRGAQESARATWTSSILSSSAASRSSASSRAASSLSATTTGSYSRTTSVSGS